MRPLSLLSTSMGQLGQPEGPILWLARLTVVAGASGKPLLFSTSLPTGSNGYCQSSSFTASLLALAAKLRHVRVTHTVKR
ncbi:uncharacterized protein LY79DRAFT_547265 [Colletotrichum navitas]|uniref:Uncharacterized protein n=1 Tax=Colletotrichum navitas TaxID=681940 RepID=A0AAD8Q4F2_9PEZI|nr:uncharacterized protein LY79DRAFT_547265 [Colletotrichum navitas]KAK1595288.1 hypothetical protein LY79DRAFT_547265 [Colletotrichum navitas]